jgi:hypothetical protein
MDTAVHTRSMALEMMGEKGLLSQPWRPLVAICANSDQGVLWSETVRGGRCFRPPRQRQEGGSATFRAYGFCLPGKAVRTGTREIAWTFPTRIVVGRLVRGNNARASAEWKKV